MLGTNTSGLVGVVLISLRAKRRRLDLFANTLARDDGCRSYVKSVSLFAGIERRLAEAGRGMGGGAGDGLVGLGFVGDVGSGLRRGRGSQESPDAAGEVVLE